MEFYENGGGAMAKLLWSSPSLVKATIPSTQMFPAPPGSGGSGGGAAAAGGSGGGGGSHGGCGLTGLESALLLLLLRVRRRASFRSHPPRD
jgi:hypothetical protein